MKDKITMTLGKVARRQMEFIKEEIGAKDDKEVISAALWMVYKLAKTDSELIVSLKSREAKK